MAYGRLAEFPEPSTGLTWLYVLPPLVILALTRFGIPVSTTFLILSVFAPGNMSAMLAKSGVGYLVAFALSLGIYLVVTEWTEKKWLSSDSRQPANTWIIFQWATTGFLWSQWLIQDLANIFVYLPRHLSTWYLLFATIVMIILHAFIFARRGGEIQHIVSEKTNAQDPRAAAVINFIFAMILLVFKEYSSMPMSTTWVFLGLLAGRETAISVRLHNRTFQETWKIIASDAGKAIIGLVVSVSLATSLPYLHSLANTENQPSPKTGQAVTTIDRTTNKDLVSSP